MKLLILILFLPCCVKAQKRIYVGENYRDTFHYRLVDTFYSNDRTVWLTTTDPRIKFLDTLPATIVMADTVKAAPNKRLSLLFHGWIVRDDKGQVIAYQLPNHAPLRWPITFWADDRKHYFDHSIPKQ